MGFASENLLGGQIRVHGQGILPSHSILLGAVDVEVLAHGRPQPLLPRYKVLLNAGERGRVVVGVGGESDREKLTRGGE